jgi:hypothetical protein
MLALVLMLAFAIFELGKYAQREETKRALRTVLDPLREAWDSRGQSTAPAAAPPPTTPPAPASQETRPWPNIPAAVSPQQAQIRWIGNFEHTSFGFFQNLSDQPMEDVRIYVPGFDAWAVWSERINAPIITTDKGLRIGMNPDPSAVQRHYERFGPLLKKTIPPHREESFAVNVGPLNIPANLTATNSSGQIIQIVYQTLPLRSSRY